jgi:hypothetical protein
MEPNRVEALARRLALDVMVYTGGARGRWALLHTLARRLDARDQGELDVAVTVARSHGWLEADADPAYRVRLTELGLKQFAPPKARGLHDRMPKEGRRAPLTRPGVQRDTQVQLSRLAARRPPI